MHKMSTIKKRHPHFLLLLVALVAMVCSVSNILLYCCWSLPSSLLLLTSNERSYWGSTGTEEHHQQQQQQQPVRGNLQSDARVTTPSTTRSSNTSKTASSQAQEELETLKTLLGCSSSNISNNNSNNNNDGLVDCRQIAQQVASKRQADHSIRQVLLVAQAGVAALLLAEQEQTKTRSSVDQTPTNNDDPLLLQHRHHRHYPAALIPVVPQYQPLPEWKNASLAADIYIVGMPKAGTSQLYHVLSKHSGATAYNEEKEYCMRVPVRAAGHNDLQYAAIVQERLFEWYKLQAKQQQQGAKSKGNKKTVNACLNEQEYWLHLQYLPSMAHNSQFILLLRDPADWLWAVWNYWIDADLDTHKESIGNWASAQRQYRSPELFHELIASQDQTVVGARLVTGLRQQAVIIGRRLVAMAGLDNVLFVRNEDMLPGAVEAAGGFLDRLSNFTALDRAAFGKDKSLQTIRNCNDKKGDTAQCGNQTNSAYEIAGGREMLPATRQLIYLIFYPECQIWAAEFGVVYSKCLSILKDLQ